MSEYSLKLDTYYYDSTHATTMVVIKVRNKRAMSTFSINEIFLNSHALENLHPIDLCILGILSNMKNHTDGRAKRILDGFSMEKIQPLIEVYGREFSDKGEVLTLRLKNANKKMQLSTSELYKNKQLIKALRYQDAIALGNSVGDLPSFMEDSITIHQKQYKVATIIMNCSFIFLLFLSGFLCLKSIRLDFLHSLVHAEILLLPFVFLIQEKIYQINKFITANALIVASYIFYIVFISYYNLIIQLPYPEGSAITESYNFLLPELLEREFIYMISLCVSSGAFLQISKYCFHSRIKNIFSGKLITSSIFWLVAYALQIGMGTLQYTIYEVAYCFSTLIIVLLAQRKLGLRFNR